MARRKSFTYKYKCKMCGTEHLSNKSDEVSCEACGADELQRFDASFVTDYIMEQDETERKQSDNSVLAWSMFGIGLAVIITAVTISVAKLCSMIF